MTSRHRHFRLSSLIELAEVEEGKAEAGERKTEACEAVERGNQREEQPKQAMASGDLVSLPSRRQGDSHTCPSARQAFEHVGGGKKTIKPLLPTKTAVGFSWTHG